MIATGQDNSQEMFPIVDEEGHIVGAATRGECHNGSKLLHPVVHLHVFNSQGEIYLQRRPLWKDIQPGRWDTAVGGHVDLGECVEQALLREAQEELGLVLNTQSETDDTSACVPQALTPYTFESEVERELVFPFHITYDGPISPSAETAGGRFWSPQQLHEAMGQGVLTPNFESEYQRLFG